MCFLTKQIKKLKGACDKLKNFSQKHEESLATSLSIVKGINSELRFLKNRTKNFSAKKAFKKKM